MQRSQKLADCSDRYRSQKDVRPLLDDILRPLNEYRTRPEATLTVAEYGEVFFLPHVEAKCKLSTVDGYKRFWKRYLAPHLKAATLRDFRCFDATNLLAAIHEMHGLGRVSLRHCKAIVSALFTFAKQNGVIDGINPVFDAGLPKKAPKSKPTRATTPDEVVAILNVLTGTPRLAVALVYFCGLRPGKARGARWEDFDGSRIHIRRSVWCTHVSEPKTADSLAPVPVYEPLLSILKEHQRPHGYILAGPTGAPVNLNNLSRRVLAPTLRAAGINWEGGWYTLRRGIGTLATAVEGPLAAKGLLRHSNISTTPQFYIKDAPAEAQSAVDKIQQLFASKGSIQ